MPEPTQNYANHRQTTLLFHKITSPILAGLLIYAIVQAIRNPSLDRALHALLVFGIAVGMFSARVMALTVQNRIIRLEMRLRLKEVLSAELAAKATALSTRQLIGLRFAGDAELPGLVTRCLAGELQTPDAIKREVRDWQADTIRA